MDTVLNIPCIWSADATATAAAGPAGAVPPKAQLAALFQSLSCPAKVLLIVREAACDCIPCQHVMVRVWVLQNSLRCPVAILCRLLNCLLLSCRLALTLPQHLFGMKNV